MKPKLAPDRQKLYHIAEPQAGYFTTQQARQAGFTQPLLSYYAKTGYLTRIARGVFRLTQFPEMPFGDLFVAWLQAGHDAVISHESALAVYELSDVLPGEIHLSVPRTASRRRRGIRWHTCRLTAREITRRAGLPVTTITRTLADIVVSGLGEEQIQQAIHEALARGLVTGKTLASFAARRKGSVARVIQNALATEPRA